MPSIKVKENEPFDVALRRFKRSCEKAGLIAEVRKREHYEKPTTIRKRAAAAAVKRHARLVTAGFYTQYPHVISLRLTYVISAARDKPPHHYLLRPVFTPGARNATGSSAVTPRVKGRTLDEQRAVCAFRPPAHKHTYRQSRHSGAQALSKPHSKGKSP